MVPFAKAGVGGIATQSYPNVLHKEKAMTLFEKNKKPEEVVKILLKGDKKREKRQVIVMDKTGKSFGFTGKENEGYAGEVSGKDFICAGNMLASEKVLKAISKTFTSSKENLTERLMKCLIAGEKAGGDKRDEVYGSASLLVVKKNKGLFGLGDRWLDLRIDYSKNPIKDLKELLSKRKKFEFLFSSEFKY